MPSMPTVYFGYGVFDHYPEAFIRKNCQDDDKSRNGALPREGAHIERLKEGVC